MKIMDMFKKMRKDFQWSRVLRDMAKIKQIIKKVDRAMVLRGTSRSKRREFWNNLIKMGE